MKNIYKIFFLITLAFVFPPITYADDVSINLDIETPGGSIFNGPLNITECTPLEGIASSASAYCAIGQASATAVWNSFGDDYFLDSINGLANDFGSNLFWLWFSNLELGSVAMNKHTLTSGENLLVTIGKMPMKIEVSTTTPLLNSTTTVSILEFGFDSSFNPIYSPSATSTLIVNGNILGESGDGVFNIFVNSTSTMILKGTKNGFLDTTEITLMPYEEVATSTATSTEEEAPPPPSGSGGGGGTSHQNLDVIKAIQFLVANQKEDGSFGSLLYTDWAAIALSLTNEEMAKSKLKNYFLNNTPIFSVFPDYERHAMALMALGINPYNGTSINYIEQIGHRFDGVQIGDKSIVNDDIFAIFPLFRAGFGEDDFFIKTIISFILSKQQQNGSWEGSPDLTAAAIQALSLTPSLPNVTDAKTKAKTYLQSVQQGNGGWGNSFSTSWVMQAISALGENKTSWNFSGSDPGDYLFSIQAQDGGVDNDSTPIDSRVWATSYAVPATSNRTWGSILNTFEKQLPPNHTTAVVSNTGGGGGRSFIENSSTTTSTTSSVLIATSTDSTTTIPIKPILLSDAKIVPKPNVKKEVPLPKKISNATSVQNDEKIVPKPPLAAAQTSLMPSPLKTTLSFITSLAVFLLIFI